MIGIAPLLYGSARFGGPGLGMATPDPTRILPASPDLPAMPTTTSFDYSVASYSGQFADAAGLFDYRRVDGLQSRADLVATGTDMTMSCYASHANAVEASVDGGAWTDITPTINTYPVQATVFSGLPDTAHTVAIRGKIADGLFFFDRTANAAFTVTGSAPACVADPTQSGFTQYIPVATSADSLGRAGIMNNLRAEAGYGPYTGPGGTVKGYPLQIPANIVLGSDASWSQYNYGGQVRFAATVDRIDIWTHLDGTKFALIVDGVLGASWQTPAIGEWGWFTVGDHLDTGAEHTYGIVNTAFDPADSGNGAAGIHSIRTHGGTGVNTSTQPSVRSMLAEFGNSITGNAIEFVDLTSALWNYDAARKWQLQLAESLGYQYTNLGIGATTAEDFTGNLGTLSGSENLITVLSGEKRAAHDFGGVSPAPTAVVIVYGTNDLGQVFVDQGRPAATASEFQTHYASMLTNVNTTLGTSTPVYCLGIMPRSDFTSGDISPWNTAIQNAITAVGTANLHYIDPSGWGLNGSGSDYTTNYLDGLHPNEAGCAVMVQNIYPVIHGSGSYSIPVSPPTVSVPPGSYTSAQSLALATTTPGAAIRYTTDGTVPSSTVGTVYSGPISLSTPTSVRAIATKAATPDSGVVRADYHVVVAGGGGGGGATYPGSLVSSGSSDILWGLLS